MTPLLLDLVACPRCEGSLKADRENLDDAQKLICLGCAAEYEVVQGIPVLLAESDDRVSQMIKKFYDSEWSRDAAGVFEAKKKHEDLSDLGQRYIREAEARLEGVFAAGGEFFLDAGAGAQPRVDMGRNFKYHVCVDFSLAGLVECRRILGDRAICIAGSLLKLPLKRKTFDGVLASHCIYHLDAGLQSQAVTELARVLAAGGTLLILYGNPRSPEQALAGWAKKLLPKAGSPTSGEFYYFAHPVSAFRRFLEEPPASLDVEVKALRFFTKRISAPLMKLPGAEVWLPWLQEAERHLEGQAEWASYVAYVGRSRA